ncbi:hypothetical protein PCC7424_2816 [Gloeothece citriformis PCC 7424]|uniref:Uncharacterized protein n=1 Tax=Gloeothece citriformis (strain PCC 7424) TaxID=65393 RepID=B7K8M5_GLOC7|nr:hypothetical protein PCC7424_2816 [Gloeothece citriformis PCC 7424]
MRKLLNIGWGGGKGKGEGGKVLGFFLKIIIPTLNAQQLI